MQRIFWPWLLSVFFILTLLPPRDQALADQSAAAITPVRITALRAWRAPDNTRLVLDLSAPLQYHLSPDSTPARLIVDLDDTQVTGPLSIPVITGPIKSVRLEKNGSGQRLVIDTTLELSPRIFQLPPNEKYGYRLVLDLYDKLSQPASLSAISATSATTGSAAVGVTESVTASPTTGAGAPVTGAGTASAVATDTVATGAAVMANGAADAVAKAAGDKPATEKSSGDKSGPNQKSANTTRDNITHDNITRDNTASESVTASDSVVIAPEKYDSKRYRNIIVAIDAGHGGEDPGASGANGAHEKDVTLAIARALEAQFKTEPGITPVLVRNGDYFIPLQERRRIARYQYKADIFVSIHADAAPSREAKGASVFALSVKGANTATSRFARMLAERENRADLIGGAAIETNDDVLRNVLADMVVAGSLEHSLHMGHDILNNLDHIGRLHSQRVEQAGFAVLKEPGMVSLLVETGFISNPSEEAKLTSKSYQKEVAQAIFNGVYSYCQQYPEPGTYFAWLSDRNHGINRSAEKTDDLRVADKDADTPAADKAPTNKAPANKALTNRAAADANSQAASPSDSAEPTKYIKHKVARGESLSHLAAQYQVPMSTLRKVNNLHSDKVKIGQILRIPVN